MSGPKRLEVEGWVGKMKGILYNVSCGWAAVYPLERCVYVALRTVWGIVNEGVPLMSENVFRIRAVGSIVGTSKVKREVRFERESGF